MLVSLWGGSSIAQIAAFSHDVLEDADPFDRVVWHDAVVESLSPSDAKRVLTMVRALTKPAPSWNLNRPGRNQLALDQIVETEPKEPEVVLIKIADRTHNLHTIREGKDIGFIRRYLEESRVLFEVLERLGSKHGWEQPLSALHREIEGVARFVEESKS